MVNSKQVNITSNIKKLNSTLKDNWNGNGALAFPKELIEKVHDILLGLSIQPELFPTALQTIQLEYDNSRKDHMEIEISLDENAEVLFVSHSSEEKYEKIESTAHAINKRVREFYR